MGSRDHNWAWRQGGPGITRGPTDYKGATVGPRVINGAWRSHWGPGTTMESPLQGGPETTMRPRDHHGAQGPQLGPKDLNGGLESQWVLEPQGGLGTLEGPGTTWEPGDCNAKTKGHGTTTGPEDHNRAWGLQGGLGILMRPGDHIGFMRPQGGLSTTMDHW